MRFMKLGMVLLVAALIGGGSTDASEAGAKLQLSVKEFTLKNGMLFLVVERPATPQVAVRLAVRAGSALEERGKTGIAHMLEHMMFKGTKNFGSTDYQMDATLQARIDAAYGVVSAEQAKRSPDPRVIQEKLAEMERLRLDAQGDLLLESDGTVLRQPKPVVYQEAGGVRRLLAGPWPRETPSIDDTPPAAR